MTEHFVLRCAYNQISAVLTVPDGGPARHPCVVLSHGLVSSKESSKWVQLSELLKDAGFAACRFDYHGCGDSTGRIEETSLTIRLENLTAIVDYLAVHHAIDGSRLGIVGSSFGSATAVVKAARDSRIGCTSFWATPHRLDSEEGDEISEIRFQPTLFDDFRAYDILREAAMVSRGLVIHGSADEVVPLQEGIDVFRALAEPKQCEIIEGGDHILSDAGHRSRAMALTLEWFKTYL